jgi:hypothetical protein
MSTSAMIMIALTTGALGNLQSIALNCPPLLLVISEFQERIPSQRPLTVGTLLF